MLSSVILVVQFPPLFEALPKFGPVTFIEIEVAQIQESLAVQMMPPHLAAMERQGISGISIGHSIGLIPSRCDLVVSDASPLGWGAV